MLISSRCSNCFTIITDPQPLEEKIAGQQSTRTAYLRIAIFFLLGAIAFPAVIWCLWSRQIIVLGETRQPEFSTDFPVLLLASLLMVIFASAFLFGFWHENRKRDPKKVPPEPTCPMLCARSRAVREFRLYFVPTMICLARIGGSFITKRAKLHRETLYGAIDPASPGLLGVDPQNLQIPRDEIADFQFLPRVQTQISRPPVAKWSLLWPLSPSITNNITDFLAFTTALSEAEIIASPLVGRPTRTTVCRQSFTVLIPFTIGRYSTTCVVHLLLKCPKWAHHLTN